MSGVPVKTIHLYGIMTSIFLTVIKQLCGDVQLYSLDRARKQVLLLFQMSTSKLCIKNCRAICQQMTLLSTRYSRLSMHLLDHSFGKESVAAHPNLVHSRGPAIYT